MMFILPVDPIAVSGLLLAGAVGLGVYATFAPHSSLWGPVISCGTSTGLPRVALTFDDGPSPSATPRVLQILREFNVSATFFVVGKLAEREPDLLRRIHAEGHLIANHSFDHAYWGAFRSKRYWVDQLRRTDAVIEQTIGKRPLLFRPPMGIKNPFIAAAVRETGHTMVTWSRRGLDGVSTTAEQIEQRTVPRAAAGDVILLHDGNVFNPRHDFRPSLEALPAIVRGLWKRGLEFGRLDEVVGIKAYADDSATA